jgi:two-component system, NarL family, response regulator NreC
VVGGRSSHGVELDACSNPREAGLRSRNDGISPEERFQLVFDACPDATFAVDPFSGFGVCSGRLAAMLGYSPSELAAEVDVVRRLVHRGDRHVFAPGGPADWSMPGQFEAEVRLRHVDGSHAPYVVCGASEGIGRRERAYVLAYVRAVTPERRAQLDRLAPVRELHDGALMTTIVLADDHAVVRSALRLVLDAEPDLQVVGEAGDGDAAIRKVRGHHPDVVVLDLCMPGPSAPDTIRTIRGERPETQVVVLTMRDDPASAKEALASGASAYVLKDDTNAELVDAVRSAARGERYLNPRLGALIAVGPPAKSPDDLSARETEILRLTALGHSTPEIASCLFLSARTVETYRRKVQGKLGHPSRAQLFRYAVMRGLIDTRPGRH